MSWSQQRWQRGRRTQDFYSVLLCEAYCGEAAHDVLLFLLRTGVFLRGEFSAAPQLVLCGSLHNKILYCTVSEAAFLLYCTGIILSSCVSLYFAAKVAYLCRLCYYNVCTVLYNVFSLWCNVWCLSDICTVPTAALLTGGWMYTHYEVPRHVVMAVLPAFWIFVQ